MGRQIKIMIQRKNLTNALIYVNTTLFTLLHSYTFQPSGNILTGSQHNVSRCKYLEIRTYFNGS